MPGTSATERLAGRLRGQLIQPGDQEYDEARSVWNGMVDRRPAAVVRCAGTADVIAAVDCARSQDLGLTVRSGGHDVAGNSVCDGGLVIDVSELGDVRVDPAARLVRVGGGATWGVVDHETQAFGLAVTGAVDSRTGVAGFTLGGGVGYLARSLGLTSDNVVSAELVLADGRRVTADDRDHADLAWALRGGRGRLGVVTSLELRLHEVGPEVMTAQVLHGMEEAADVLAFYRDTMQYAPNEVSCYAQFMSVPSGEPLRDARPGAASLALVACHAGLLDEGRRALEPLAAFGRPLAARVAPMPYVRLQRSFEAGAYGGRFYGKTHTLEWLSDDVIATVVDRVDPLPGAHSKVFFEPMGGAIARVDRSATAWPHRRAAFGLRIASGWDEPADDEAAIAWTCSLSEAVARHATGSFDVDDLDGEDDGRRPAANDHGLSRLREVERRYDPDEAFGRRGARVGS